MSLNAISYNAVIRALEIIRDGRIPSDNSKSVASEENDVNAVKSFEPPIVTDIFIDTVGDPGYYKSRLVQALGKLFYNSDVLRSLHYVRIHPIPNHPILSWPILFYPILYLVPFYPIPRRRLWKFHDRKESRRDIQGSKCRQYYRQSHKR